MNLAPAPISSDTRAIIAVIAISFALRAALAAVMGFTIDETYNVVVARQFALSYYDHPPAIMWLIAAAVKLTGSEHHLIVRLPTLILFSAQSWLLYQLTAFLFDKRAALFAVIAISSSPLFAFYSGAIASTDEPLVFGLTGAALFVARAVFTEGPTLWRTWLIAGFFFGVALLSKFSAILILPGFALFLLTVPRHRHLIFTAGPYVAAFVAVAVFMPVILWNIENGFVAFAFQGSRAALGHEIHIARALTHLGVFIVATGAVIWLVQIAALVGALRAGPRDERRWFFASLAIVPIVFFLFLDMFAREGVAPHWLEPGYVFTFPLMGAAVVQLYARFPRTVWWTFTVCIVGICLLLLAFLTHTRTGWLRTFVPSFNDHDPMVSGQTDWWSFRAALKERGYLDSKRYFILSGRYWVCFKAQLVLSGSLPVVCISENPIANALWLNDTTLIGRDAIIAEWWDGPQTAQDKFEHIEQIEPIWITEYGRPVMRIELALGRNLQRPIFEPSR